ncbi:Holliday junction resolvase RuvX [Chondromyces crocatus]|uniref:Putative pre-16S rRNA nuclease n=1 Tax=Chondromyces crocatus TaxID=52 RepID=A0A0K1EG34_CHOCO|nr:Holliday junction resolvase RuvX [Chondromyces crocatus]AKT39642.1 Holliday junction DNA helicase [Chondromyces crocatus]
MVRKDSGLDEGRVAAIDLGAARIGVAVTDELGLMAHPRPPLDGSTGKAVLEALTSLAREEGVKRFLVGLPLNLDGREGSAARKATTFAQELANATGIAVELVDERLSTVEASRRLREGGVNSRRARKRIDGAAAAVLLQAWLDRRSGQ